MGYSIKYGASDLFVPGSTTYAVYNAKITQSDLAYSKLVFTMPPSHPLTSTIALHDSANLVTVEYNGKLLFKGVITGIEKTLMLETRVTCASELIYLSWVETRYKPSDRSPVTALAELTALYNTRIDIWHASTDPQFKDLFFTVDPQSRAGYVGYSDPVSGNIVCDAEASSPTNILDIIVKKMVEPYGGYLRLRYGSDGTRYIGIFDSPTQSNSQTVQFGVNLADYSSTITDEEMYTACYPVGGTGDEIEGQSPSGLVLDTAASAGDTYLMMRTPSQGATVDIVYGGILIIGGIGYVVTSQAQTLTYTASRVDLQTHVAKNMTAGTGAKYVGTSPEYYDGTITLARVPDQTVGAYKCEGAIVYHNAAARAYGIKCMTMHDSDIKDGDTLLMKAIAALGQYINPKMNIKVKAVDMAFTSGSYSHLVAGETVRVISAPHDLDATMYVRECTIDLQNPANTVYMLGSQEANLTRANRKNTSSLDELRDNLITELNDSVTSDYIGGLS